MKTLEVQAQDMIARFLQRFEPSYELLLYYAALPLVLTPELLNYLRHQFLRGQVPWVAEIDLLLSELCRPVGFELYAMDTPVRDYFLQKAEAEIGTDKMEDVGRLLLAYLNYRRRGDPFLGGQDFQMQQWAAMVYLKDKREQVALEIAEAFKNCVSPAEFEQLAQITQKLAPSLTEYPALLDFAQLITELLSNRKSIPPQQLEKTFQISPSVTLSLPAIFQPQKVVGLKTILLVEDNPRIVAELSKILTQKGSFKVRQSENVQEILTLATEKAVDLVLVNFNLADSFYRGEKLTGLSLSNLLKPTQLPIIGISWIPEKRAEFLAQADGFYLKPVTDKKNFINYLNLVYHRVKQQNLLASQLPGDWSYSEFTTPTVNRRGEIIQESLSQVNYYTENLDSHVSLEMVYIPSGTFQMGAAKNETGAGEDEYLQHPVTLPAFYMGKYPITQAQWKAIALLPKIERDLNPDPSYFKGENRPVECVNWYDVVEYCQRLSKRTGKEYRLPSEAQWEYACRAGTKTPFYFGETLTTEIANYNGNYTYAEEGKGVYREETTPVGKFPANAWGLYDLHGNVWEWCLDDLHDSYQGAPKDGSAWIDNNNHSQNKLLRGGSWYYDPNYCRCADRYYLVRGNDDDYCLGFRVVCLVGRTL